MNRRRSLLVALATIAGPASAAASAAAPLPRRRVLQVGPGRSIKTIAEAARLARDGDRVEVDAGDYPGDVAVWQQDELDLIAIGGRVHLAAAGASAEGKGIWVVRGGKMSAQGFDFSGAAVPDHNGAGIRLDGGWLTVRDCSFIKNETGILTGNHGRIELTVQGCEFAQNTWPDGQSHHLYAGAIARLTVTGSYFHHAHAGHLLKSRAATSAILYNRLTDEAGGEASYELEFPNGGIACVIGNIVSQSADTQNATLISFGAEGYPRSNNELYLASNTLIDRPGPPGIFLAVRPGADVVHAVNNLLVGAARRLPPAFRESDGNVLIGLAEFEQQADSQFRLRRDSPLTGRFVPPGAARGRSLAPERQYRHPHSTVALNAPPHNPGSMQTLAALSR